jgi:hypothetical protein
MRAGASGAGSGVRGAAGAPARVRYPRTSGALDAGWRYRAGGAVGAAADGGSGDADGDARPREGSMRRAGPSGAVRGLANSGAASVPARRRSMSGRAVGALGRSVCERTISSPRFT